VQFGAVRARHAACAQLGPPRGQDSGDDHR